MATAQRMQVVVINLELPLQEAMWLKAAMQNPLYGTQLAHEDPQQQAIRESIFNALKDAKV